MSQQLDLPKIEFPCEYEIRILGSAIPDFESMCKNIIKKHVDNYDGNSRIKKSREGRFVSVKIVIIAKGEPHLKLIYDDLMSTGQVKMVI